MTYHARTKLRFRLALVIVLGAVISVPAHGEMTSDDPASSAPSSTSSNAMPIDTTSSIVTPQDGAQDNTLSTTPSTAPVVRKRSVAADNTAVNIRDRNMKTEPTADQAGNTKTDVQIMSEIRKSVMNDKSLSMYAHNVKIIAANGQVTLKGPVRSNSESNMIESKAVKIVGDGNVTNELSVKDAQ